MMGSTAGDGEEESPVLGAALMGISGSDSLERITSIQHQQASLGTSTAGISTAMTSAAAAAAAATVSSVEQAVADEEYSNISQEDQVAVVRDLMVGTTAMDPHKLRGSLHAPIVGMFTLTCSVVSAAFPAVLTLPWGFGMSGIAAALFSVAVLCACSWYAAVTALQAIAHRPRVNPLQPRIHGQRRGAPLGAGTAPLELVVSFAALLCACFAVFVMLSNNFGALFEGSAAAATDNTAVLSWWNDNTVPAFTALLVMPLLNIRNTFYFENAYNINFLWVGYVLLFIAVGSLRAWWTASMKYEYTIVDAKFTYLAGVLSTPFCSRSIVLASVREGRRSRVHISPAVCFCIVGLCFSAIGLVGYLGIGPDVTVFCQDILDCFPQDSVYTLMARTCVTIHGCVLLTLLAKLLRLQLDRLVRVFVAPRWPQAKLPQWFSTLFCSLLIVCPGVAFGEGSVELADLLRYMGSFCGMLDLFFLPAASQLIRAHTQGLLTVWVVLPHLGLLAVGLFVIVAQFVF